MTSARSGRAGPDERMRSRAWQVAARVTDPELPMLTLSDLGVLRDVELDDDRVTVVITPTYSGCPALVTIREDLLHRLREQGFGDVQVAVRLDPAWTTDWITDHGKAELRRAGISAPGPASNGLTGKRAAVGPIPLRLGPTRRQLHCPQCGSNEVTLVSEFGSTACTAHYRCRSCLEPFDHIKEI